jgi:beta-lactam-binding protein with PASTA domain
MILKLIPKEAQRAMNEQGIDPVTLQELLKSELPDGEIIRVEGSDGTEVRISIE